MNRKSLQLGLSLVELMVSIGAGMIVVLGVTTVYVSTINSSSGTLKQSRLNQELSAMMSVMTNDIRRAGIWQGAGNTLYTSPQNNIFASSGNTALTIVNQATNTTINPFGAGWPATTSGDCILYAYDNSNSGTAGTLDNTDIVGFRLHNGVVQMRTQGDTSGTNNDVCTTGTWADMSDSNAITVTALTFDMAHSACINTFEPNGTDDNANGTVDEAAEKDCYSVAPSSGDITTQTRQIDITITGEVTSDTAVKSTQKQSVRVRNDLVLLTP